MTFSPHFGNGLVQILASGWYFMSLLGQTLQDFCFRLDHKSESSVVRFRGTFRYAHTKIHRKSRHKVVVIVILINSTLRYLTFVYDTRIFHVQIRGWKSVLWPQVWGTKSNKGPIKFFTKNPQLYFDQHIISSSCLIMNISIFLSFFILLSARFWLHFHFSFLDFWFIKKTFTNKNEQPGRN